MSCLWRLLKKKKPAVGTYSRSLRWAVLCCLAPWYTYAKAWVKILSLFSNWLSIISQWTLQVFKVLKYETVKQWEKPRRAGYFTTQGIVTSTETTNHLPHGSFAAWRSTEHTVCGTADVSVALHTTQLCLYVLNLMVISRQVQSPAFRKEQPNASVQPGDRLAKEQLCRKRNWGL